MPRRTRKTPAKLKTVAPKSSRPLCIPAKGCNNCGSALTGRQQRWCSKACAFGWYDQHIWSFARRKCMIDAGWKCRGCGARATEVDHIVPRMGMKLSEHSCLHHQSNLRALCHSCHVNRKTVFKES